MESILRDVGKHPLHAFALVRAVFLHNVFTDLAAGHVVMDLFDRIDPGDVPEIVLRIVNTKRGPVHERTLERLPASMRRRDPDILNGATFQHPAKMYFG